MNKVLYKNKIYNIEQKAHFYFADACLKVLPCQKCDNLSDRWNISGFWCKNCYDLNYK